MNSEKFKKLAYDRAAKLLNSKDITKDIHQLCLLTKEQNPEISNWLLEELVLENIINFYDDRDLDFYWYMYQNSVNSQESYTKQAA